MDWKGRALSRCHQPLRAVAQGKTAPIFHPTGSGGAQFLQGAVLLAAGGAAAGPAAHGKIGRVGDNQVKASGGEREGAQITANYLPRQSVDRQVFPGNLSGQGIDIYPGEGEPLRPAGQQQKERPAACAQVAHAPAGLYSREAAKGKGVAPKGKDSLGPGEGIWA